MDARSLSDYLLPRVMLVGRNSCRKNESIDAKVAELCPPIACFDAATGRVCSNKGGVAVRNTGDASSRDSLNGHARSSVMHK
jgi:hypothetical protein